MGGSGRGIVADYFFWSMFADKGRDANFMHRFVSSMKYDPGTGFYLRLPLL